MSGEEYAHLKKHVKSLKLDPPKNAVLKEEKHRACLLKAYRLFSFGDVALHHSSSHSDLCCDPCMLPLLCI